MGTSNFDPVIPRLVAEAWLGRGTVRRRPYTIGGHGRGVAGSVEPHVEAHALSVPRRLPV